MEERKLSFYDRKEKLRQSILDKKIVLSPSSFRKFLESPKHFLEYKLEPRKPPTDAVIMGSIVDCLLTEEEEFENKFSIINASAPSTSEANVFCQKVIRAIIQFKLENKVDDIDYNHWVNLDIDYETLYVDSGYKLKGSDLANQNKLTKSMNAYSKFIVQNLLAEGKQVITNEHFVEAKGHKDRLMNSRWARKLVIDRWTETQKKVTWEIDGWKFRGIIDGTNNTSMVGELKQIPDASERKASYQIRNMKYPYQLSFYHHALGMKDGVGRFLVYDRQGYHNIFTLSWQVMNGYIADVREKLNRFYEMAERNQFDETYEFWGFNGSYTL